MIQHPGDSAARLGGMLLTGVSAGGEGLNAVLGATGAGAADLDQHTASDSGVEPLQQDSEGPGASGSSQQEASELIKA